MSIVNTFKSSANKLITNEYLHTPIYNIKCIPNYKIHVSASVSLVLGNYLYYSHVKPSIEYVVYRNIYAPIS